MNVTNFQVSSLGLEHSGLRSFDEVSEVLTKSRSRSLRSRLHHRCAFSRILCRFAFTWGL